MTNTPIPWKVFRAKTGVYIGVGEQENGAGILDAGFGLWRSGNERDANAELAVRAVNCHDDLVAALQNFTGIDRKALRALFTRPGEAESFDEFMAQADAALAKAAA